MHKQFPLLVAVLFLCGFSAMHAQLPDIIVRTDLGISTNYSLENVRNIGPSWSLSAGIGIGPLSALATIGLDQFLADEDVIAGKNQDIWDGSSTQVYSVANYPMSVITISGDLRYRLQDMEEGSSLYFVGGPAFFRMAQDDIRITSERGTRTLPGTRRNSYGFVAGARFEVPLFKRMIWLYGESKFGAGVAGDKSGFEPHYANFKIGAEIKL